MDDMEQKRMLGEDEEQILVPWNDTSIKSRRTKYIIGGLSMVIAVLGFWIVGIYLSRYYGSRIVTCGGSVEEARSRGCTFDPLSDLWLPPKCSRRYQDEYIDFNHGRPWRYWADPEGQHEIFNRSLYVNDVPYFSKTDDHLVHCALNLFRLADSLTTGALVGHDGPLGAHVQHCATSLLNFALAAPELDVISTPTISRIGFC